MLGLESNDGTGGSATGGSSLEQALSKAVRASSHDHARTPTGRTISGFGPAAQPPCGRLRDEVVVQLRRELRPHAGRHLGAGLAVLLDQDLTLGVDPGDKPTV